MYGVVFDSSIKWFDSMVARDLFTINLQESGNYKVIYYV